MPGQKSGGTPPAKTPALTPAQQRQASAVATILGNRTLANAGLPLPGHKAFADQKPKDQRKPAKDPYVPGLTVRTAVARGTQERVDQHGLLTPAQRKAEARATDIAPRLPTFHELHNLKNSPAGDLTKPILPHMTLQQVVDMLGVGRDRGIAGAFEEAPSAPTRPFPAPMPEVRVAGRSGQTFTPDQIRSPAQPFGPVGGWLGKYVASPAANFADKGLATATDVGVQALGEAFNPGALKIASTQSGQLSARDNPVNKINAISGLELSNKIQHLGWNQPDININTQDITGLFGTDVQAADGKQHSIPFSELAGKTGWGLTPEAKKRGLKAILKNGWTRAQVEAMGGDATTFLMMQYNKPDAWTPLRAAAADIVSGGSQTVGAVGLAGEIMQGRGVKAVKQYGDLLRSIAPIVGKHPWGEEIEAHPFFALTAGLAGAKGIGALGHLRAPVVRNVKLAGHEDPVTGGPLVMPMGHYDQNLYMAVGQNLKDLGARLSPKLAERQFLRGIGDLYVRQQRARLTPGHVAVQAPFIKAERSMTPQHREDLMAIVDHGGEPGLRNAVAHFEARAAERDANGNPIHDVPQQRLELGRLIEVANNLTPEDHAWIHAHADIAKHTSDRRQIRGWHSADSQLFRQYETVIEMGASAELRTARERARAHGASDEDVAKITHGEGPYTRALQARDERFHMHDNGGPSDRWLGRQKEIERDIKNHTKGASGKMARLVKQYADERKAYLADLRPWRATQREIKAREPEKPVKPELTVAPREAMPKGARIERTLREAEAARDAERTAATDEKLRENRMGKLPKGKLKRETTAHVFSNKTDATRFAVNEVNTHNEEHFAPTGDEKLKATAKVEPNPKGKGHIVTITRPTREKVPEVEAPKAEAPKAAPKGKPAKPVVDAKAQREYDRKKAEHDAWKAELDAHNATRPAAPERPRGLPRHAGRLSVHEGEVTKQTKRAKGYAEAEAIRHPEKDKLQIAEEYHTAVNEAVAAHHAEPGAMIPAYVKRVQPPVNKKGKFRRGENLTPNLNMQKQHPTTGETVRSGDYIYDTSSPLRENFTEQLTDMKSGLYNALVGHPLVHDVEGGGPKLAARIEAEGGSEAEIAAARQPRLVPSGFVAVPIHHPGSHAQVTEPSWGRDTPINKSEHHDPNAHKSLAKTLYDKLTGDTKKGGEEIPDGERVLLIPEGLHHRLDEYANPNGGGGEQTRYDRINQAYQKVLIGTYPSTWLGNAPGSIPLAFASGAISPQDYWRSFMHGPQGPISRRLGIERDNSRNAALQNLGVSGGLGAVQPYGWNLMTPFEIGRQASIHGENFAAGAAWEGRARVAVDGRIPTLRKIIPGLDKIMPQHLKGMAARMSVDAATLHRWLRENKIDVSGERGPLSPEIQALVDEGRGITPHGALPPGQHLLPKHLQEVQDRLTQDVIDFMSEGSKPHGSLGRKLGKVILFQNWMGHIVKLTLFTLPIKHPRRALLLNTLSMYGNQYRQEHGAYPGWMTEFLPIMHQGDNTISMGLGQLTPTASAQNLAQAGSNITDTSNPTNSILNQIIDVTSPLIQPEANALLQQIYNMRLHPNERAAKYVNPLKVLGSGLYYAVPGAHKFGPTSGYKPGSALFLGHGLPYLGADKKRYYEYIWNGDGTYTKVEIPWGQRPGGHPMESALGDFMRVIGLPLEKSATRGVANEAGNTSNETFHLIDWYNKINPPIPSAP